MSQQDWVNICLKPLEIVLTISRNGKRNSHMHTHRASKQEAYSKFVMQARWTLKHFPLWKLYLLWLDYRESAQHLD